MTLYYNAKIYTPDGIKSWMLLKDGKVIDVGVGEGPIIQEKVDMEHQIILPGLIDAHLHVFGLGRHLNVLRLKGTASIAEIQTKLSKYARQREGWIEGRGWDQGLFEDGLFPSKSDLDRVVTDKPVVLFRACHHVAVVNSKALEMAGIVNNTKDPKGGEIERNESGVATGILKENAMNLVIPFISQSRANQKAMISAGLQQCLALGLTSVQPHDEFTWDIYQELQKEGKVPIRVYLTLNHEEMDAEGTPKPGTQEGMLSFDRVKIFADGSLGGHTAAMREVYADKDTKGIPIHTQEVMNRLVGEAKEAGCRVEIHAIGDAAAEIVINAVEANHVTDRPILTHAQILGKDLIKRMSTLGIIASIQPPFIITDGIWVDKRLGMNSERRKYSYAWKTLLENGVHVAGGSDAPIESNNPLLGIYAAIFREDVNGNVWREEEKLTFDEALHLYTLGGAYASKEEHRLGQLSPGYEADFVVLNEDVIQDPTLLKNAEVQQVFISGVKKFSRSWDS
ncbi:MAG: amidohydrolase [Promethearchaeota archaeon]